MQFSWSEPPAHLWMGNQQCHRVPHGWITIDSTVDAHIFALYKTGEKCVKVCRINSIFKSNYAYNSWTPRRISIMSTNSCFSHFFRNCHPLWLADRTLKVRCYSQVAPKSGRETPKGSWVISEWRWMVAMLRRVQRYSPAMELPEGSRYGLVGL